MRVKFPFIIPFLLFITKYESNCGVWSFTLPSSSTQNNRQRFQILLHNHPKTLTPSTQRSNPKLRSQFFASANDNGDGNGDGSRIDSKKASVSLSSSIASPSSQDLNSPTAIIDLAISILISDLGSIIIGSIGLLLALYNRLSTIDFDSNAVSAAYAEAINIQSRNDLLAVFASGAVLLNGLSKLDVTSVLAESVDLNGLLLEQPLFVNDENDSNEFTVEDRTDLEWAMESILTSTPAKTAVLLKTSSPVSKMEGRPKSKWVPIIFAGVVPSAATVDMDQLSSMDHTTPILDRFLKQENAKESYLPTLQALPGKVEFTYLPDNSQEALLLPIKITAGKDSRELDGPEKMYALALGSDTAKSFTPRDVAWCQVLAQRIGDQMLQYSYVQKGR